MDDLSTLALAQEVAGAACATRNSAGDRCRRARRPSSAGCSPSRIQGSGRRTPSGRRKAVAPAVFVSARCGNQACRRTSAPHAGHAAGCRDDLRIDDDRPLEHPSASRSVFRSPRGAIRRRPAVLLYCHDRHALPNRIDGLKKRLEPGPEEGPLPHPIQQVAEAVQGNVAAVCSRRSRDEDDEWSRHRSSGGGRRRSILSRSRDPAPSINASRSHRRSISSVDTPRPGRQDQQARRARLPCEAGACGASGYRVR